MTELPEQLLDSIYDAAADRDLWVSVLTQIADLTNSQGGILFGQSFGTETVYFDYNGRLCEDCNRAYKERHVRNPWNEAMVMQPIGRIVFSDEVVPLSTLRSTSFHDEVLQPQDVSHNAMIALAGKQDFQAAFNICRSTRQGPFGEGERQLLSRLLPHMRRSIQLGFRIEAYQALQRAAFELLDRLSEATILLDALARVLYLNAEAKSLESNGILCLRNSTVTINSSTHGQRFNELIRAVIMSNTARSMSVPRPSDGQLLTVLFSSVRGKDITRFAGIGLRHPAALIFIIDPAGRDPVSIQHLRDAYGLTQAESRVALTAASGITIPEAATQLGLSPNTVKTHLRRIFAKMGVNRQVELARLIASIGLLSRKL